MQQRLHFCGSVEVARLQVEGDIGGERGRPRAVGAEVAVVGWQQQYPADDEAHRQNQEQRRENPSRAAAIEAEKAEPMAVDLLCDQVSDQETGNHEEDIDADKAARKQGRKRVKSDDQQHGDCPQAIDVFAVRELAVVGRHFAADDRRGRNAIHRSSTGWFR